LSSRLSTAAFYDAVKGRSQIGWKFEQTRG